MNSPYRVTENRSFGPTHEWERLPVLGADRQAYRARVWRRLLVALAGFWLTVICAVIGIFL